MPNDDTLAIVAMLDELQEMQAHADHIRLILRDNAEAKRIVQEYEDLQERLAEATAEVDAQINTLRTAIEGAVLKFGITVRGKAYTAVWTKPRVTYDLKMLEGYAAAHPEILPFRHVGQPSVSIRPARRDADV